MSEEKKMHVYIDIETTATTFDAGVWQIGAVILHDLNEMESPAKFSMLCRPEGAIDLSTMAWIMSKPDVALNFQTAMRSSITTGQALAELLTFLQDWNGMRGIRESERVYSWGNFDVPILENQFKRNEYKAPWHYGSVCSLRDVALFKEIDDRPDTSEHHALSDALELAKFHLRLLGLNGDLN